MGNISLVYRHIFPGANDFADQRMVYPKQAGILRTVCREEDLNFGRILKRFDERKEIYESQFQKKDAKEKAFYESQHVSPKHASPNTVQNHFPVAHRVSAI